MAKILIIDDEKPDRDVLTAIARTVGHDSRVACNGRDGVAQFEAYQPDLVITDILMPKSGHDLSCRLGRRVPGNSPKSNCR